MARGRKKKEKVERTIKLNANEFRKAVAEASRLKEQAASYNGFHGQHVKNYVERAGFSRQAFAVISKMDRLGDDLKRQSLMDEIVMGFELMGWNDQGNLFDRVQTKIENDVVDDEDQPAPTTGMKQDGLSMEEAERAFKKTQHLAPKPDALSALAADPDAALTH